MNRVLTEKNVAYAAQRLGCSVANVYRLVENGDLPYVDVGAREYASKTAIPAGKRDRPTLRFLDEDLDAFIASRRQRRELPENHPRKVAAQTDLRLVGRGRYR